MRTRLMRGLFTVVTGAAVSAVGITGVHASARVSRGQEPAKAAGAAAPASPSPGSQLWVQRYGATEFENIPSAVEAAPGGGTVFVTGKSVGKTSNYDYATIACKASTGAQLWVKRYNGPGNSDDRAASIVVSPSGGTVYVTGESPGATSGYDYATIAYNATTGAQAWIARYNGPGDGNDSATAAAVSPSTGTVYVTGSSAGTGTMEIDYATVAYQG
jgi:hypothetical protein